MQFMIDVVVNNIEGVQTVPDINYALQWKSFGFGKV